MVRRFTEEEERQIKNAFTYLAIECHQYAFSKGFWDHLKMSPSVSAKLEKLALIHSEISEAVEAVRNGDNENFAEELADTIIRICDLAGAFNLNLGHAILEKMKKNQGREFLHGKQA